ncbi:putative trans-sialidase [Trypanosoma cruzi]|nr:putative trans-sialidase [Trypanosoma cruzi]
MLVGKYSRTDAADARESGADDSGLLLAKGNVSGVESNEQINWEDPKFHPRRLFDTEHKSLTSMFGSGGSGVHTEDDTLVFPVEAKKKQKETDTEKEEKTVSLIMYTLKDTAGSWKLSKGMSDGGCSDPSVVEWKDKKLIMMTVCDDGRRRVYESADKGESWTEALGTLSCVWSNKQGNEKGVRSGFITATIDGDENKRNVMLVTLPVYSEKADKKEAGNGKSELHLWLTDNTHIVDIGPVSDDDAAASSLLYRSGKTDNNDEKLIALYEKNSGGKPSPGMVSVLLTEQLQRVKDVLATWKKVDETVSKLCTTSSAEKDTSSGTAMPTNGLVGFLSGNFSNDTWRDEYLGVNATVKKKDGAAKNTEDTRATKTSDGVKFHGAWAEWPVGSQEENQLYHFANYNFTLVATVSINGVPESGSVPVMGVRPSREGGKKTFELSYDSGKKWRVLCDVENPEDQGHILATDTTHNVVILLRNGSQGSAYVDGQPVGGDEQCKLETTGSNEISHFYIGGNGGEKGVSGNQDVSVTVTNVLLYNRPLNDDEITALNTKLSIPKARGTETVNGDTPPVASKQATPEAGTPSILGGQKQNEQDSLKKSKDADSGGASASAVSTVSIPSAEKDSVVQVESGTSSDGTQTVGGGSTADGEPTMEKREGGTDAQEEGIHAQGREVKAAALSSSLGNLSQGNNTDAGTVCGSGLLPLLLLLGLWGFAAL